MKRAWWVLGLIGVLAGSAAWWAIGRVGRSVPAPPQADEAAAPADCDEAPEPTLVGVGAPASGADGESAQDLVRLTGRVVAAGAHAPLAGVLVSLERDGRRVAEGTTGPDGCFLLRAPTSVDRSPHAVRPILIVSCAGRTLLRAVPPDAGLAAAHDLGDLVLQTGWTVSGTVRGEDGEPVPDAHLMLEPGEPPEDTPALAGSWTQVGWTLDVHTDAEGGFSFAGVPPRPFDLEVVAKGYASAWLAGRVRGDGARLDLRLKRGQSLRVRVVDGAGEAVGGARVNLYLGYRTTFAGHYKTHLYRDRTVTSNALGHALLTGLEERPYHVTAWKAGRGTDDARVWGGRDEVVLRLQGNWTSYRYGFEYLTSDREDPNTIPPWHRYPWTRHPPEPPTPPSPPATTAPPSGERSAPVEEPPVRPVVPADVARLRLLVLSADRLPMARVYVCVEGPETEAEITENDGTEVIVVSPGSYTYRAIPCNFGSPAGDEHGSITLPGGTETYLEIVMSRLHAVDVELRDTDGSLARGARVEVLRGDETKQEWIGRDGRLQLFAEEGQPFAMLAFPDGRATALLRDIAVPVLRPVVLRIPASREITGRVLDPSGIGMFGVRVVASRQGLEPLGEDEWKAWTDDTGRFVLRGPADGTQDLTAHHKAYGSITQRVVVGVRTPPVTLRLRSLLRVKGRVVDALGLPVARARIGALDEAGGDVVSRSDGAFVITLPRAGAEPAILVKKDGFLRAKVGVSKTADEEMEIRLSRGVELTLAVRGVDKDGLDIVFEDAVTGGRIYPDSGSWGQEEGRAVCTWAHAPDGSVTVHVRPRGAEEKVLEYTAQEGETVELSASFP